MRLDDFNTENRRGNISFYKGIKVQKLFYCQGYNTIRKMLFESISTIDSYLLTNKPVCWLCFIYIVFFLSFIEQNMN